MWSEPIESALAEAHTLLADLKDGRVPGGTIAHCVESLQRARRAREFEQREGRLVTPEDRW